MKNLKQFKNVDVFAILEGVMKQNTKLYQSDFEEDKKYIAEQAKSFDDEDRTLLWMSYPCGTRCFRERDVFIRDTASNIIWRFYKEQLPFDRALTCAVELTSEKNGKIMGNLYELDYGQHYERVKNNSIPAGTISLICERGTRILSGEARFNGNADPELGRLERLETQPKDMEALRTLLREEKRRRNALPQGNSEEYIAALLQTAKENQNRSK